MRDKVRGRLSECSSLPRECSDPKFLRRRCRSSISVVDSRATFGAKAKRNLCATTTAKLFRARTRWVARFFGSPSRLWKEPRKGLTAGRSSITGSQSLPCGSISPTKRISRAPYRFRKHRQCARLKNGKTVFPARFDSATCRGYEPVVRWRNSFSASGSSEYRPGRYGHNDGKEQPFDDQFPTLFAREITPG